VVWYADHRSYSMVSHIQLPDDSSLRANRYETKCLATSEAPLEDFHLYAGTYHCARFFSPHMPGVRQSPFPHTVEQGRYCRLQHIRRSTIHYTSLQSSCSSWSCTDRRQYEVCAGNRPTVGRPVPEIDTHFRGIQFYTPRHRSHSITSRESPRAWIGFVVVLRLLSSYYFGATVLGGGHTWGADG
jgi:hypothetical protein